MTETRGMTRRELLRAGTMALVLPKLFAQSTRADAGAPDDEAFWARVRDLFPIDPNVIQLNNAAIGSTPFVCRTIPSSDNSPIISVRERSP